MKKDQTTGKTRLQFTRKAVAKLGKSNEGGANALPTLTTLVTLTQRCCGGEDSSQPVPSFCGGGVSIAIA